MTGQGRGLSGPVVVQVLRCPRCDVWRQQVSEVDPDCTIGDLYDHLRRGHDMDTPEAQVALAEAEVTYGVDL